MKTELPEGKIIVTGAAGFIGSALVWRLNELGYESIICCDRLKSDERWRNLVALRYEDFVHADDLLESSLWKDVSVVFHLGACSATTERDADYLLRNNFEFTKRVAGHALARGARFLQASSAATYGDGERGMSDQTGDLNVLRPLNMYGYSKQMFDLYAQRHGFMNDIVGLKYFNVFGPNEGHKGDMRSVVHKAYEQVCSTGSIRLFKSYRPEYADGEQERDFVYVKDAVDMTIHLAARGEGGGLFNVGSGRAATWNQLAHAVFEAMGEDPKIEYIEMPEEIRDKYQYRTCADMAKMKAAGYDQAPTSLRDAVRDYVQNYLIPGKLLGE